MKLQIPYQSLQLINYEGAGNKTPVLDISAIAGIGTQPPQEVKSSLERDEKFRKWLQREGKLLRADSVMIYYQTQQNKYDFVTFVGEPNGLLTGPFSTMCGNGIRSLALHVFLSENNVSVRDRYIVNGIRIWAGTTRVIRLLSVNKNDRSGSIEVEMGPFTYNGNLLRKYTNGVIKNHKNLSNFRFPDSALSPLLQPYSFGAGFNGDKDGEPHLVMLTRWEEFLTLLEKTAYRYSLNTKKDIMNALRYLVCLFGKDVTFTTDLFPLGINFNLGLVLYDEIFMTTHERNLSLSRDDCIRQQEEERFCLCNTQACGTGGAAVVNIARRQGFVSQSIITTNHPGGTIVYRVAPDDTVMTGPAKQVRKAHIGIHNADTKERKTYNVI